jgi:hypothetical protein
MQYSSTLLQLLASGIIVISSGSTGSANVERGDDPLPIRADIVDRDLFAEAHRYCLALAVYFEGGSSGESELGQRHIARVVVERARADKRKWGGSDICDVVFYKRSGVCQFSFACLPAARRTPRGGTAWEFSLSIAHDELAGRSSLTERSIRYYMNAALTPDRNACRFRKEFVPVVTAGRHEFFREPTKEELSQIAKAEYAECLRHAQALKSKRKRSAKARAKHKRVVAKARKKGNKAKYARR